MIWPFNKPKIPERVWPDTWQLIPVSDVMSMLEYTKGLNVSLLKKGCEILKIPFIGGGTYFFKKGLPEEEIERLKDLLLKELNTNINYVIAYSKELKPHPDLAFYKIIAISSNDILDLKKALKVHKLKAFI